MSLLSILIKIGADASGFVVGAKQVESSVNKLSNSINGRLKNQIAGAFGVTALVYFEKRVIEFASHINDLSDRVGVSTDALQEWSYAAKQNGADIDDVVGFFEKLGQARQKALGNNQESIASFKKLGVTLDDLKKKRLEDIGIGVGRTVMAGDAQNLGASLRDVGGRGATKLITTFKGDVEDLSKAARDAGAVIRNDTIQQLDDLGDAADNFAATLRGPMAQGLLFVVSGLNMLATGVKAIGAYFGQAAGKSPTKFGQVMNVIEAASPIQILMKSLFPAMTKTTAGLDVHEDQFSAFKKVFADAAEQEQKGQEAREAKRQALRSHYEEPTDSGAGHSEKMSVTAREQIGAYVGGANPLLQVAQRSEKHLEAIKKALLKTGAGDLSREDIYA